MSPTSCQTAPPRIRAAHCSQKAWTLQAGLGKLCCSASQKGVRLDSPKPAMIGHAGRAPAFQRNLCRDEGSGIAFIRSGSQGGRLPATRRYFCFQPVFPDRQPGRWWLRACNAIHCRRMPRRLHVTREISAGPQQPSRFAQQPPRFPCTTECINHPKHLGPVRVVRRRAQPTGHDQPD